MNNTDISSWIDYNRQRTNGVLKILEHENWFEIFTSAEKPMNNVFWLVGHIAVSENFLLNYLLGKEHLKISWARDFGIGSTNAFADTSPSKEELLNVFKSVHENTLKNISDFDVTILDNEIEKDFNAIGTQRKMTYREVIMHACWHESYHAGQIQNLCKFYNIKTF